LNFTVSVIFAIDKKIGMGHSHDNHEHHGHMEAEQNEIGGPVTFALICLALAIVVIYFLAQ
jgi:hypothetical protein